MNHLERSPSARSVASEHLGGTRYGTEGQFEKCEDALRE